VGRVSAHYNALYFCKDFIITLLERNIDRKSYLKFPVFFQILIFPTNVKKI
jgi:hypothetical protein